MSRPNRHQKTNRHITNVFTKMNKEIIHKTEYIDKELPTVVLEQDEVSNMTRRTYTFIKVSDTTSAKALKTLLEVRKELKNE